MFKLVVYKILAGIGFFFFTTLLAYALIVYLPLKPKITSYQPQGFFCGTKSLYNYPDEEQAKMGKALFNMNCAACHALNRDMTGPRLGNIYENKYPYENYLFDFITKQDSLLKVKDSYALKLRNEWNTTPFVHQYHLSNKEIKALLIYTTIP